MKTVTILLLPFFILISCAGETEPRQENIEQLPEVAGTLPERGSTFEEQFSESDYDHSEYIGIMEYDAEKMAEWPSVAYRSDGFRPGIASEWIRVIYTPDREFIAAILYWNVPDEEPLAADLIETQWEEGEISGWTGTLGFSDDSHRYGFGIIEDRFTLLDEETGLFQEFFLEEDASAVSH
ncbi:MAG: hypothetical protein EA360_10135 [Balneolaceae bacterium]|nr:MAG: hypothetical protein EA360_10135 [Balneolaceae bacterium]